MGGGGVRINTRKLSNPIMKSPTCCHMIGVSSEQSFSEQFPTFADGDEEKLYKIRHLCIKGLCWSVNQFAYLLLTTIETIETNG
jgi:hypothetical protein